MERYVCEELATAIRTLYLDHRGGDGDHASKRLVRGDLLRV